MPGGPGLLDRLRTLRTEFRAAYAAREAELRAALLPSEDAVDPARRGRHRRPDRPAGPEDDEPLYTFF